MEWQQLSKKEAEKIIAQLEEAYGVRLLWNYVFFKNTKRKIFVVDPSYLQVEKRGLRINRIGMYLATEEIDGLRLSLEGAQLIKPQRNLLELTSEQLKSWVYGATLEVEKKDVSGYVLLQYRGGIVSCGKYRDGTVFNTVAKDRRIKLQEQTVEEKLVFLFYN